MGEASVCSVIICVCVCVNALSINKDCIRQQICLGVEWAIPQACGQPDPPTQSIHGLDPPRELKKINTSQPNQLKQLKQLVPGGPAWMAIF